MDQLPVELHPDVPDPEIGHFGTLRSLHFASIFSLSPTIFFSIVSVFNKTTKSQKETKRIKTKQKQKCGYFWHYGDVTILAKSSEMIFDFGCDEKFDFWKQQNAQALNADTFVVTRTRASTRQGPDWPTDRPLDSLDMAHAGLMWTWLGWLGRVGLDDWVAMLGDVADADWS